MVPSVASWPRLCPWSCRPQLCGRRGVSGGSAITSLEAPQNADAEASAGTPPAGWSRRCRAEGCHLQDGRSEESGRRPDANARGADGRPSPVPASRTSLPAPMSTRSDFSVWSILKRCIGLVSGGPGAHARAAASSKGRRWVRGTRPGEAGGARCAWPAGRGCRRHLASAASHGAPVPRRCGACAPSAGSGDRRQPEGLYGVPGHTRGRAPGGPQDRGSCPSPGTRAAGGTRRSDAGRLPRAVGGRCPAPRGAAAPGAGL